MENKDAFMIQATKEFAVPVNRLYEAWTRENDLKEWWHPMGNRLVKLNNELKEGGPINYSFETAEHQPAFAISGEYKEVKRGERLVYTWNWEVPNNAISDSKFLLTVVFTNNGEGSKIDVTQENFKTEEAVQPHKDGWEKALNDLQQYLS